MKMILILGLFSALAWFVYNWRQRLMLPPAWAQDGTFFVRPDDLRVVGEKTTLAFGIAAMTLIFIVLLRLTWGAIIALVIFGIVWVKIRQGQLLGQSVKVTDQQLPRIHRLAVQAAERLCMPLADVFVTQNPLINAYAIGFFGRKSVVLHSATVEAMSDAELCAIIGHEMTHIKCQHTHWLVFTQLNDTLRIPIVSDLVSLVLLAWSRKAEYTCDRGGLLACGDLQAAVTALSKVAIGKDLFKEMNLEAFFSQNQSIDGDDIARLSERLSTHPYIVHRLKALHEFSLSEFFQRHQQATQFVA